MLAVHELAVTESLVDAIVERVPNGRVVRVRLDIGRLSGVEPDAVRFCFDVCARGTTLEGAVLELCPIPATAVCRTCGDRLELDDGVPLCGCGSADVELISGTELRIREVEVM
jgi:hydrogenase nickel incorporation protein HypA/HybF